MMRRCWKSRPWGRFAVLGGLICGSVVGCGGDEEGPPGRAILETLEPGMPTGEVMGALPPGAVQAVDPSEAAGIREGYWLDRYFVDGTFIEVLWLHDAGAGPPTSDFRRTLTPVVFVDETLDGWGWDHFDERRSQWGLAEREALEDVLPGSGSNG